MQRIILAAALLAAVTGQAEGQQRQRQQRPAPQQQEDRSECAMRRSIATFAYRQRGIDFYNTENEIAARIADPADRPAYIPLARRARESRDENIDIIIYNECRQAAGLPPIPLREPEPMAPLPSETARPTSAPPMGGTQTPILKDPPAQGAAPSAEMDMPIQWSPPLGMSLAAFRARYAQASCSGSEAAFVCSIRTPQPESCPDRIRCAPLIFTAETGRISVAVARVQEDDWIRIMREFQTRVGPAHDLDSTNADGMTIVFARWRLTAGMVVLSTMSGVNPYGQRVRSWEIALSRL